jgi:5-methylcytosine-specific restriction endonuclease McrA
MEEAGRNKHKQILWLCLCDCGNEVTVAGYCLRNGNTKSCGCLRKELVSESHKGKNHHNYIDGRKCNNPLAYARYHNAKHHALKLNQTPLDANLDIIQFYYTVASAMKDYHVDHIKPLSKGGLHHENNLQILSAHLNLEKNNKYPLTKEEQERYKGFRL